MPRRDDEAVDPNRAEELLRTWTSGEGAAADLLGRVLAEVEATCEVCRQALGQYPPEALSWKAGAGADAAYEDAVRQGEEKALDHVRELEEAPGLVEELIARREVGAAGALLAVNPRFHRWGLAITLLDWSESLLLEVPEQALVWARLGSLVAARLPPTRYGTTVIEDARAVTKAQVARALLACNARVDGAEDEIAAAQVHAEQGTGAAAIRVEIALTHLEILVLAGRWQEAIASYQKVAVLPGLASDASFVLRATLALGGAYRAAGAGELAARSFQSAVEAGRVEGVQELSAMLANLELIMALCELERWSEAGQQLGDHHARFRWPGPPLLAGRLAWAEARLAARGRGEAPSAAYERARALLVKARDGLGAARVAMDHLLHLSRRGGGQAAAETDYLLETLPELYVLPRLPRWAVAVLLQVQERAVRGDLGPGSIERLRDMLNRPAGAYETRATLGDAVLH